MIFFEQGRSAVEEVAQNVQALHPPTNLDRGITFNVGLVSGGQSINSVAETASCHTDMRYKNIAEREEILE